MENIIVKLFKESGMSVREFATAAGLKYSTAHDITTGKAKMENIGAGAFVRIAHVFHTTADALIEGMQPAPSPAPYLSPDERELVAAFRAMDGAARARVIEYAAFQAEAHPLNKGLSQAKGA